MNFNEVDYTVLKKNGDISFKKQNHNKKIKSYMENNFERIRNFPYKKYSDIKKWQLKRISEIVDYAYENIPLYKEKYDKVNYKKGSIKTWKDFEKLPLLYKEELIDGFPDKIVKSIEELKISTRSSGSSGKFVTLAVNVEALYEDTIQGIRQYKTQSNFKYKADDVILFIYTCPWWITDIDGEYIQEFIPTTSTVEEALRVIKEIKPLIISTYPTYLEKLAEYKINLSEYGVDTVIVHSEQSIKKQRLELQKILHVNVIDEYSSEELTRIALECPYGTYHIEEDASYIEIVDKQTLKKLPYGKEGIVVGTNLLNTATPIIRYVQNDLVIMDKPKKCKCHNNCRTITKIKGRYMDSIITDENNIIPAAAFMDLAYNWYLTFNVPIHGLKYQFVQESDKSINVDIIKGFYNIDTNIIEDSVYLLVPKTMKVNVNIVDKFKYSGKKYRPVVSLVKR